ncbi:MAG: helix-turn-helix transcriptional regulator, partial [Bacteroidales bacterium]|nr:helix-turn-helix transcriptional regulator [Bacteroidales bacterium]
AARIGVSPSRISDYISGRAEPTLRIASRLCTTLGISPAAILGL